MSNFKLDIFLALIIVFVITVSCDSKIGQKEMKWHTFDTIYDGLPLYIRRPDIQNIKQYQARYSNLLCVTQKFDKVKSNGLPESDYNKTLEDFDGEICDLFEFSTEGIIFLIETFGGERYYWFYIKADCEFESKFGELQKKYPEHKLDFTLKNDSEWGFIKDYPFEIYNKDE
jgi:hypothetical protein